jgi:transcriptional regulator with XRE-family HTH domain
MYIERNVELNDRIKHYLRERNIKPAEFAELMSVSRVTVSLWLSGKRTPSEDNQNLMCRIFGINYLELTHTEEELAAARIRFLFKRFNLNIHDFERFEEIENDIALHFLGIITKYLKKR